MDQPVKLQSKNLKQENELQESLHTDKRKPGKVYKCDICGLINSNSNALSLHILRHQKERPFKCKFCPRTFVINYELSMHINNKHSKVKEEKYKCKFCHKTFNQLGSKYYHEDTHGILKYKCHLCNDVFDTRIQRCAHRKKHLSKSISLSDTNICTLCGKSFSSLQYLETHVQTHISRCNRKKLRTVVPDEAVKRSTIDLYQDSNLDIKGYIYYCTICKAKFDLRLDLDAHIDKNHPAEKVKAFKYPCIVCSKLFDSNAKLQSHAVSHRPKNYRCPECDYNTARKGDLKSHIERNHPSGQVYECKVCEQSFVTKAALARHNLKHANMNFKCERCSIILKSKISLRSHIKYMHHAVKAVCDQCGRMFTNNLTLSIHIKNVHSHESSVCHCKSCGQSLKLIDIKKHLSICQKSNSVENISTIDGPTCVECNIVFSTGSRMKFHYKEVHPGLFYPCTMCWRYYHTEDSLKNHLERHEKRKSQSISLKSQKTILGIDKKSKLSIQNSYECFACGLVFGLHSQWEIHVENKCTGNYIVHS